MRTTETPLERSVLVAYGSETGNAQDCADEVAGITRRLHFLTRVSTLDSVDLSALSGYSIVIVAVSTTGQGDLPINARVFWKSLLRRKLPPTFLKHTLFTTFGLGDSSYPKFNWAVRKLQKRFLQLGADEFYPHGEGDEQHPEGLDASFVPWLTGLRQYLLGRFPLDGGISPIPENELLQPKWKLSLVEDAAGSPHFSVAMNHEFSRQRFYIGHETPVQGHFLNKDAKQDPRGLALTLEKNQRLTPGEHWQDVRQFVFTTPSSVKYEPGDVLIIYPKNRQEDVDIFISMMQWTEIADKPVRCILAEPLFSCSDDLSQPLGVRLPLYTTVRSLLTNNLDFTAIPRRSFFSVIAHFTLDEIHKERLLEFTRPEYVDDLYDYTTRPRRSILEVLQEFKSVRIPWQWAVDVLPELRGRQFSIASGGELKNSFEKGTRFDLLVAIVKYKTVIKKIREGVCTRYLASLPCGTQIQAALHKGGLGISRGEANLPVIMIGPGTGVAPMRSLIWERFEWGKNTVTPAHHGNGFTENESKLGETWLFFGCRRRDADYFFEEEWAKLSEEMPLQVITAFSRDQARKIYVQDLIKEHSATVFRLLYQCKGIVYVCGSSGNMPRAVRASLIEAFKTSGGLEQAAAEAYLLGMEKAGRYRQETW